MKKFHQFTLRIFTIIICACSFITVTAKEYEVSIVSDPEGATVYLNGKLVCNTTPAIISIDKKMIDKNLLFRFEKSGYEPKTVILSFDKKDIKKAPIVYGKLDRDEMAVQKAMEAEKARKEREAQVQQAQRIKKADPSIPAGQETARVSRDNPGQTSMESTILRWYFDSDPRGARIYYRVISNVPAEVKNTNETYLTSTPYEETKSFSIPGLTYENSRNVTIEIKISRKGYEDQVKRYNVRQALDQQEISGFFELVPKDVRPE